MSDYQTIYLKINEMICDAKDLDEDIDANQTLDQIKFDSLDYVELMVLVKREYNVALTADFFIENSTMTIKELIEYISKESSS
ncbi:MULTISPECIES: acyl carrier protein [Providencia]|uniref:Acyl carrier protein n=2 Tax=Providencia TaxID=586 RepID=A0AA42FIG4_9GAMM|nr:MULTISPECIES: acyl carrier protein [Providencia]MBC8653580.1 acyl carrier protein [Providencia vermicola]APC11939.1 Acyl carrier protein [Providencia rettgeri]AVL75255.1 acyl carrier protein [Providencia rettgeri]EIL1984085.1 acyl carrier protein [Providencia rettgeri]EIU7554991.1 acyl carrier protein [Providencia rettgeri]